MLVTCIGDFRITYAMRKLRETAAPVEFRVIAYKKVQGGGVLTQAQPLYAD